MSDTVTEESTVNQEVISKITLVVLERVSDGHINMEASFNNTNTVLLIQAIAYLLDSAFDGEKKHVDTVVKQIPSIVDTYFKIKEDMAKEQDEAK